MNIGIGRNIKITDTLYFFYIFYYIKSIFSFDLYLAKTGNVGKDSFLMPRINFSILFCKKNDSCELISDFLRAENNGMGTKHKQEVIVR